MFPVCFRHLELVATHIICTELNSRPKITKLFNVTCPSPFDSPSSMLVADKQSCAASKLVKLNPQFKGVEKLGRCLG